VVRTLDLYYTTIEEFFDSLPRRPLPHRLAADTLLAAVHGIIAFPRMTRTMKWSDIAKMADVVINGMVDHWIAEASASSSGKRK
jgi:hypothetical protein